MRRIVVFDTGWGGEIVAERLKMATAGEIAKVIAWQDGNFEERGSAAEIRWMVERRLKEGGYLGTKDVIVLAEPGVALAAKDYLARKYPEQSFVGGLMGVQPSEKRKMMVLATPGLKRRAEYQEWRAQAGEIIEPDCDGWAEKIHDGELDEEEVRKAVEGFEGGVVLILSTNFIDVRRTIERAMWRKAKVVDLSKKIVREACVELGLKGVDGELSRRLY